MISITPLHKELGVHFDEHLFIHCRTKKSSVKRIEKVIYEKNCRINRLYVKKAMRILFCSNCITFSLGASESGEHTSKFMKHT